MSFVEKYKAEWYIRNRERILRKRHEYYLMNKEKVLKTSSEYQKKNPEIKRKSQEKYRNSNKEKLAIARAEYDKLNPDKKRARWAKYHASKMKAIPSWFENEKESIVELYGKAKETNQHVDHIVPLQSKHVCGLHCLSNLQLLDGKENRSKSNRYWEDMWSHKE